MLKAHVELFETDVGGDAALAPLSDEARWSRVKRRLRAELGEDIFSSWFVRMELDGLQAGVVRLSVPTRFLRSWILSHYADRLLLIWRSEDPAVDRVELVTRSAVIRGGASKRSGEPAAMPDTSTLEPPVAAANAAVAGAPARMQPHGQDSAGSPSTHG